MNPPRSILDPEFRYVNAASTDVKKTWAKERKRLAQQQEIEREQEQKVRALHKAAK